jgi:VWFA-related protein
VSVTDENAKPFPGLKTENFSVTIDKSPRNITAFRAESIPASIGLLVDASGSMGPETSKRAKEFQRKISEGLSRFLAVSNRANNYFAAAFDAKVAFSDGWIRYGDRLELINSGDPRGTALYDSIYYGLQRLATAHHSRRVLVVVSDGIDSASKRMFKEVRELIKNSDVAVYAICIVQSHDEGSALGMEGQGVLDELTAASGGRSFLLHYDANLEIFNGAFEVVARDIHAQYQLTIDKEPGATPAKWRKLRVKLNKGDAKGWPKLSVRARDGYFQ